MHHKSSYGDARIERPHITRNEHDNESQKNRSNRIDRGCRRRTGDRRRADSCGSSRQFGQPHQPSARWAGSPGAPRMDAQSARTCATTGATPASARNHARAGTATARARNHARADPIHTPANDGRTSTASRTCGANARPVRSHARARAHSGDRDTGGAQPIHCLIEVRRHAGCGVISGTMSRDTCQRCPETSQGAPGGVPPGVSTHIPRLAR